MIWFKGTVSDISSDIRIVQVTFVEKQQLKIISF